MRKVRNDYEAAKKLTCRLSLISRAVSTTMAFFKNTVVKDSQQLLTTIMMRSLRT